VKVVADVVHGWLTWLSASKRLPTVLPAGVAQHCEITHGRAAAAAAMFGYMCSLEYTAVNGERYYYAFQRKGRSVVVIGRFWDVREMSGMQMRVLAVPDASSSRIV